MWQVSSVVDERTRHELYYRPFAGAVEAGVGSFMCSYNLINGIYACENEETLQRDLKGTLGFDGWVMSDWGATHSTSIKEGLDQVSHRERDSAPLLEMR
jgi:beta-glucosidase